MYTVFINQSEISNMFMGLSEMLAKLTLLWPALLNLRLYRNERKKFFDSVISEGSRVLRSIRYPNQASVIANITGDAKY